MPHSPFQQTVHPAIDNINSYKRSLARWRVELDDGPRDLDSVYDILTDAEKLAAQCVFLEGKLDAEKWEAEQVDEENVALKKRITTLESELKSRDAEIKTLKGKLKKGSTGAKIKDGGKGNSEGTPDALAQQPNPQKRKARTDGDTGGMAVKKAKAKKGKK